ncbi:MAG: transcription antitermination factor NusB [Myxococcota bacterium]
MGTRRKAREIGLQLLYQLESEPDAVDTAAMNRSIDRFFENFEAPIRAQDYAEQIARGYWTHRRSIDEAIQRHSPRWKLERMTRVDRNVLRLCLYEAVFEALPPKVALDEAVELAKRFGTEQSGAFVNGVLDAALKDEELREHAAKP